MMRQSLLFTCILLLLCGSLFAQQDADFSMYLFDGLYINPAYAGSHDALNATVMYRDQWLKMPGAPQTASVAINSPLPDDHVALGFTYTNDRIGVTQTNSAEVSFAYRILVGKKKDIHLSFGICGGFDNYHADFNSVPTTDPNDPSFVGNYQNRLLPNVGAGFYSYSSNFFAGFSVPRILANRLNGPTSSFATSTGIARQYQNLLAQAGYVFNIGKKVKFVPSLLLMYVPKYAPPSFDFNANFVFIDRIFFGMGYRLNDSYQFTLAGNVTKNVRIGYCYDLTVSALNKYTSGTHEIMASFEMGLKHGKFVKDNPVRFFEFDCTGHVEEEEKSNKHHSLSEEEQKAGKGDFDPELLRMYLMGATNPGISNKIESSDDIIDLHLTKAEVGKGKIPPEDALFIQLDKFEKSLERAIASGKLEFRAVHGLGTGKLKQEIFKILDKHPHVRSYSNEYHNRYGFGSTLIYLQ